MSNDFIENHIKELKKQRAIIFDLKPVDQLRKIQEMLTNGKVDPKWTLMDFYFLDDLREVLSNILQLVYQEIESNPNIESIINRVLSIKKEVESIKPKKIGFIWGDYKEETHDEDILKTLLCKFSIEVEGLIRLLDRIIFIADQKFTEKEFLSRVNKFREPLVFIFEERTFIFLTPVYLEQDIDYVKENLPEYEMQFKYVFYYEGLTSNNYSFHSEYLFYLLQFYKKYIPFILAKEYSTVSKRTVALNKWEFMIKTIITSVERVDIKSIYSDWQNDKGLFPITSISFGNNLEDQKATKYAYDNFNIQCRQSISNEVTFLSSLAEYLRDSKDALVSTKVREDEYLSFRLTDKKYTYGYQRVYNQLVKENFISSESSINDFKRAFTGNLISNRVIWIESTRALKYFIDKLEQKQIIDFPKKEKWKLLTMCFINSYDGIEVLSSEYKGTKKPSHNIQKKLDLIIREFN